jgi:rare lipoprotein A
MRKVFCVAASVLVASLMLAGCSSHKKSAKLDPFAGVGSPYYPGKGPIPFGGGKRQIGSPYQVAGKWFTPRDQPGYDKTGLSSWYGEAFHRRKTSNGEWFDMATLTAAHPTLPLPSYAKVTNLENGKTIIVRVNDRGPFVDVRVLDVSKRVAEVLGYKQQGIGKIRVQYIGPAPLNDKGSHLMAMNRELKHGTPLRNLIASADGDTGQNYQVATAEEPPVQRVRYAQEPVQQFNEQVDNTSYVFVQVGSFADPENAERIRNDLSEVGKVQVTEVEGSTGLLYRVRIGPFTDPDKAQYALNQVQDYGMPDARLVETHLQQASAQ